MLMAQGMEKQARAVGDSETHRQAGHEAKQLIITHGRVIGFGSLVYPFIRPCIHQFIYLSTPGSSSRHPLFKHLTLSIDFLNFPFINPSTHTPCIYSSVYSFMYTSTHLSILHIHILDNPSMSAHTSSLSSHPSVTGDVRPRFSSLEKKEFRAKNTSARGDLFSKQTESTLERKN